MPHTVALKRTIRATNSFSRERRSSMPISMSECLHELEETPQQPPLGPTTDRGDVDEQHRVAQESERPAQQPATQETVRRPEQRPDRRHSVAGKVLPKQRQGWADNRPSFEDQDRGGEEQQERTGCTHRAPERDAVELRKKLGQLGAESFGGDLLVVLSLRIHVP